MGKAVPTPVQYVDAESIRVHTHILYDNPKRSSVAAELKALINRGSPHPTPFVIAVPCGETGATVEYQSDRALSL